MSLLRSPRRPTAPSERPQPPASPDNTANHRLALWICAAIGLACLLMIPFLVLLHAASAVEGIVASAVTGAVSAIGAYLITKPRS